MSDESELEELPLNHESLRDEFDEMWYKNISLLETSIETCIYGNVIWDVGEYEIMKFEGLTDDQKDNINRCLVDGLIKLTHDFEWSTSIASNIVLGIEGSIKSMMFTKIWDNFYDNHHSSDIAKWIYNNIKYQLNGEELYPTILTEKHDITREDYFCNSEERYLQREEVCRICIKSKIPSDLIPKIIAYAIPYSKCQII